MVDLKKLKKIILNSIVFLFIFIYTKTSYAIWYEDPTVMEKQEDIDCMWWLSKKKKELLKKEQDENIKKWKENNKGSNNIKWLYDENDVTKYPKNKWEVIDETGSGKGYNYYFNEKGYLLRDTITPDFRIVDKKGREVDNDLRPILYDIPIYILKENADKKNDGNILLEETAKVIIDKGVIHKEKQRIYDNTINKNVALYVDASYRYTADMKGTVSNEVKWKSCQCLKGCGSYVIFNNPNNNFNKIVGKIADEYRTDGENETNYVFTIYDADKYDEYKNKYHFEDVDEIYRVFNFSSEPQIFSFTFDRSIKRLRFELICNNDKENRKVYFKDLKFGFSKSAYKEELERKKEEELENEELKRLGIYVDDLELFEYFDEDGEEIDEDYEDEYGNSNIDDYFDEITYIDIDEIKSYEDRMRDKVTGPAFDESLQNEHTWRDSGPAFIKEYSIN